MDSHNQVGILWLAHQK